MPVDLNPRTVPGAPGQQPRRGGDDPALPGIIGSSAGLQEVVRTTRRVAPSRACVLIVGETGTGKELIARAIHDLSPRSTGPYIRVNCGALTESLLESELFGHVKGSFTGAVDNRTGRFEAAHAGSIFLDEINSTSPKLQVKLLRVLQEGEFERVGDNNTKKVDTRIIAATNRDLLEEIEVARFREDLYYRLNVVPIYLPPLRERRDDIEPLVLFFLNRYAEQNRREMRRVHADAMRLLREHDWPGNIRELQNYVERAVILGTGPEMLVEHLPPQLRGQSVPRPIRPRGGGTDLPAPVPRARPRRGPRRRPVGQRLVRPDRRPGRARADPAGAPDLRPRPDQGRRPPGHQPQHPAQEALRVPHGRRRSRIIRRRQPGQRRRPRIRQRGRYEPRSPSLPTRRRLSAAGAAHRRGLILGPWSLVLGPWSLVLGPWSLIR